MISHPTTLTPELQRAHGFEPKRIPAPRSGQTPAATDLGELTDAQLLRAHADGDRYAFDVLVRRHRDRLWAVALRTMRDPEEAADALQDALISAFRAAGSFRAESAVTTWLHRIVVNACLDRIRRRKARPTVSLPEEGPGEPTEKRDQIAERVTSMVVESAMGELPAEQRSAITLVDLQGYSVADSARILGVAEGTIKSRCARGRARLAIILEDLRTPDRLSAVAA
ncbi:MAG TPA: RNA polymerase sigma factor SigM [Mycobacteriales bacterium]|jgi:RNA polymerase sigma-70 factor (ECF subfamily)|nr:RNA polymerase sigma factor SigM [Mycobacteriales bacterium]